MTTIDEKGNPVLIEAVYYRYHSIYAEECGSIEEALAFLENGEDYGELSSVGVYVEGEPRLAKQFVEKHPLTEEERKYMEEEYKNLPRRKGVKQIGS